MTCDQIPSLWFVYSWIMHVVPHSAATPSVSSHDAFTLSTSSRGRGLLSSRNKGHDSRGGHGYSCNYFYCVHCGKNNHWSYRYSHTFEKSHKLIRPNLRLTTPFPPILCLLLHLVSPSWFHEMNIINYCKNLICWLSIFHLPQTVTLAESDTIAFSTSSSSP